MIGIRCSIFQPKFFQSQPEKKPARNIIRIESYGFLQHWLGLGKAAVGVIQRSKIKKDKVVIGCQVSGSLQSLLGNVHPIEQDGIRSNQLVNLRVVAVQAQTTFEYLERLPII